MEIGFIAAFVGGVLAPLSPCSALLLPAFFASTVGAKLTLLAHGAVFYLGLIVTLVPFGLGVGALGALLVEQRGLIIAIASITLIVLGAVQMAGLGFDVARLLPGASAVQRGAADRSGYVRTFLLGAVGGVAGFCAGPILGAVLTLAMGQGSSLTAGALLAVYGAGMVVPLMVIAALWGRIGARGQRALRGRTLTIFGRQLHSTSLVTGLLIMGVGLLFWFTNGLVSLPSLVPTDVQAWVQTKGALLSNPVVDIVAILLLTAGVLAVWLIRRRRATSDVPQEREAPQKGDATLPVSTD